MTSDSGSTGSVWMGYTEAVAIAHYRQTGKAIDKFYEQAAGTGKTSGTKKGAKTVAEHAGIGCSGIETGKTGIAVSPSISTPCNAMLHNAPFRKKPSVTPTGIEPVPRH